MPEFDRYRIAETNIGICSIFDTHRSFCRDYTADFEGEPDLMIHITMENIENEMGYYTSYTPTPEAASLSFIYRTLAKYIIQKGGFMMHGAVIEYDGYAYAFTAPSGTGKSTHIKNWRRLLGDKIDIVNGDKPLIIRKNGKFYACGTPWAGKEGWQRNVCVPMGGICRVHRGSENTIKKAEPSRTAEIVLSATLVPEETELLLMLLDSIDTFSAAIPSFELYCTAERDSAIVSFEAMTGDKIQ